MRTAKLFAASGASVVLADIDLAAAERVAAEINGNSAKAVAITCDVSDDQQVKALFADVEKRFGGVDVLANVAAYRGKHATMEMTMAEWDIQHAVNTRGTFLCLREAARLMRAGGKGGSIVNVSSVASVRPVVFPSMDYDSSKAGVNAITRQAALEFAADGIRVNAVLPGATISEGSQKMAQRQQSKGVAITGPLTQPGRILMGRLANPLEQARAILFLASPASSYITGQLLVCDGGALLS
jgi:NAD(P)-dependent dehydrogenase (short-subunit alcohol dehydrogenase family)